MLTYLSLLFVKVLVLLNKSIENQQEIHFYLTKTLK